MSSADSSNRYRVIEAVYQRAIDLPRERRAAFIESECAGDLALRQHVESLLHHWDCAPRQYLENPVHALSTPDGPAASLPDRIAAYTIIRLLGRGGMGAVYEAEQQHPRRRVALKVIRSDVLSDETLRRFRHEADVLGQLRHPGIAQIYEFASGEVWFSGARTGSQPFFAMELVSGVPLIEYGIANNSTIDDRLGLIARICDAVQHAHQKGVIHRDLKPSNIVVDEDGRPKVLDFGVARVLQSDARDASTHTSAGQLIGTLAYMSPEQLTGHAHSADTRSDVYSLGVLAFELLTGQLPFGVADQPLPQALRVLTDQPPKRAASLRPELAGDVDAILGKALERDPDRRYGSAAELAADIHRRLRNEPVAARPATAWYTLRKAVARHRGEAVLVALLLALVCSATVALALLNWRAVRGWREAETQRGAAETARAAERDARVMAESVGGFLQEMLAAARPAAQGKDASLLTVLRSATQRLDRGDLRDQPVAAAAVLTTIGSTWQALSDLPQAEAHFVRALELRRAAHGEPHADVAVTLNHIGEVRYLLADYDAAERYFRDALEMRTRLFGERHAGVAECYNNLALVEQNFKRFDRAEALLSDALRIWRETLGNDDPNIETCLHNLAGLMADRGRAGQAAPLIREVLALRLKRHGREDHPLVVSTRNNLAQCLGMIGEFAEADSLHRTNLAINRAILPPGHVKTHTTVANLAESLRAQHRYVEAEALLREEIGGATLEDARFSASLAHLYDGLGVVLVDLDRPEQAEPILHWLLDHHISQYGEWDATVAATMNNLGGALADRGDLDGAAAWIESALHANEYLYGTRSNASHATYAHHLAMICRQRGECDRAEALLRDVLQIRRATLGPNHPLTRETEHTLQQHLAGLSGPARPQSP